MGDFPYLEWLARKYIEKGEISHKWTDYVKAHGLANFALAKDDRPDRKELVYSIEKSWYQGKHPLTFSEHQEMTSQHRTMLKEFRKQSKSRFDTIRKEASFSEEIDSASNQKKLDKFSNKVFTESENLSKEFVRISKQIMQSSVSVLGGAGEISALNFSVIALGSVAKGEATPYSDLEYAFIVEKHSPYYERLAVDSYFRIANLGESPPKCFDIEEVKEQTTSAEGTTVGYRIDGLTANAGNIPTGNGKGGSQCLTLTLDELKELYKKSATTPFDGKPGDMSDMLSSTALVLNHGSAKPSMHEKFEKWRNDFEKNIAGENKDFQALRDTITAKRLKSFAHDIKQYTFLPDFVSFAPPNNLSVKVKEDIFRYPTLLANNFRMCLGLSTNYPWATFSALQRQGRIKRQTYENLKTILAISIYIRTSAYIRRRTQTKSIAIVSGYDTQLPDNMFLTLGCLLIPIKNSIACAVNSTDNRSVGVNEILEATKKLSTNPMLKVEVYYFCGEYQLAIAEFGKIIPDYVALESFLRVCEKLQHWYPDDSKTVRKYVQLLAYLLYYGQFYSVARKYLLFLINAPTSDQHELYMLLAAHCYSSCGQHIQAKDLLTQVKSNLTEPLDLVSKIYSISANHPDSVLALANIGRVFNSLSEYKMALSFHLKSLEIVESTRLFNGLDFAPVYHNIGETYIEMSDYENATVYLHKAQEVLQGVPDTQTSQLLTAENYRSLGKVNHLRGKHREALDCYNKSEEILCNVKGVQLFDTLARLYRNIGVVQCSMSNYPLAIKYHNKSLELMKSAYGADAKHEMIAGNYMNIANALHGMGDYRPSIDYFNKSIDMFHTIYGPNANHQHIAAAYQDLGNSYYRIGDYKTALHHHQNAIKMAKVIHGDDSNTQAMVKGYLSIGSDFFGLDDNDNALLSFHQSLEFCERIYGKDYSHIDVAINYRNIGNVYNCKGEYQKSLHYLAKELQVLKALFGSNSDHTPFAMHYIVKANVFTAMRDFAKALNCYIEALRIRRAVFGSDDHCMVIQIYVRIFFLLRAWLLSVVGC